jgi:hypothetical protein
LVSAGIDRSVVGQIRHPDEAVELASELYALETKAEGLRRALRANAAEAGPIQMPNDIQLGFRRTARVEYPAKTISTLNTAFGFDLLRALKADSTELKKIAKKYPDYIQKLAKHGKNKSSTTLAFSGAANDDDRDEVEE